MLAYATIKHDSRNQRLYLQLPALSKEPFGRPFFDSAVRGLRLQNEAISVLTCLVWHSVARGLGADISVDSVQIGAKT